MKNIHVIPTDKPSRGYILGKCIKELSDVKIGQFTRTHYLMFDEEYFQAHNIYITSEENTKFGDWCLDTLSDILFISDGNLNLHRSTDKKIIMTTDSELIKDGVQEIEDEFLEWFVKNPSCERVELMSLREIGRNEYEIIIPEDLDQIIGQKMYEQRDFEIVINTEFYAEGYARQMWGEYYDNEYDTGTDLTYGEACKNDFLAGVEYQKQQMYTEDDLKDFGAFIRIEDRKPDRRFLTQDYFELWLKRNKI